MDAANTTENKMDAQQTIQQIGPMNLMAVGARDFVSSEGELMFRVGSKRSLLEKVIVTLDSTDTYSVRYVAMKAKTYETVADKSAELVYAEQLGQVVRSMGDR